VEEFIFEECEGLCFVTLRGLPMGVIKVEGLERPMWLWTSEMLFWQVGMLEPTLEGIKKQLAANLAMVPNGTEKIMHNYKKSKWTLEVRG